MKRVLRWARSHLKLVLTLLLFGLIVLLNAVAYMHAHAMTHFSQDGSRTPRPEELSVFGKVNALLTGVKIPRPLNETSPDQLSLSFEVHHFAGTAGIDLEAWFLPCTAPKGLVLMFHGYAACKAALLPEAKAFHELAYAVLLTDFRGCGGSGGSATTVGYSEADEIVAALTYARNHWQHRPLLLFGQSMGSAAILRAVAVHGVEVDALILECPFDRLLSAVENRFAAMGLPSFPSARLLVFWGGVQQGFPGFSHNPVEYAEHARCPVLLLHGEDDRRVTKAQAQAIFDRFPGRKQLELFTHTGHGSLLLVKPEQWKRSVSEFLRAQLP